MKMWTQKNISHLKVFSDCWELIVAVYSVHIFDIPFLSTEDRNNFWRWHWIFLLYKVWLSLHAWSWLDLRGYLSMKTDHFFQCFYILLCPMDHFQLYQTKIFFASSPYTVIILEHHPALWIKICKMHIACIIFCSTHRFFEVMPIQGLNNLALVDTPTRRAASFLHRLLFSLANTCTFSSIGRNVVPRLLTRYVSAAVITRHRDTKHRINFRIQPGLSRINTHVTISMSLECVNQTYSS